MRGWSKTVRIPAVALFMLGAADAAAAQTLDPVTRLVADIMKLRGRAASKPTDPSPGTPAVVEDGLPLQGADTELASRPLVKGDVRTFDVAKFKLGMAAREVARIAAAAGMRTNSGNHGMVPFDPALHGIQVPSFQTRVATAAARQHRAPPRPAKVVGEVTLVAANGDKAVVHFFTTEDGPRVSAVTFITSFFGATPKVYLDALTAKYGRPKESSISGELLSARWCAAGDPQCGDRASLKMVSGQTEVDISLDAGFLALQDLERRIETAAASTAAATATKPTF